MPGAIESAANETSELRREPADRPGSCARGSRLALVLSLCLPLLLSTPLPVAAATADDAPLAVRNLAPFSNLFGLPRMAGAGPMASGLGLRLEQVSNFSASQSGSAQIFQDGETSVVALHWARSLGTDDRFDLGVELPWIRHSGGELDRPIDGFHRAFDLPEGGRERAPRDRLDYRLRVEGTEQVRLLDRTSGVGDVRVGAGLRVHQSEARRLRLRAQLKLPTGDARRLTGSGAADVSLWLEALDTELLAGAGLRISLGAGASYLGRGDLAADQQRQLAAHGHFGLHRRFGAWDWSAQLDAHSALYDLPVDQLGAAALQGTLGVRRTISGRHTLTFSLFEDLIAQSTSDVVFQLAWHRRFEPGQRR